MVSRCWAAKMSYRWQETHIFTEFSRIIIRTVLDWLQIIYAAQKSPCLWSPQIQGKPQVTTKGNKKEKTHKRWRIGLIPHCIFKKERCLVNNVNPYSTFFEWNKCKRHNLWTNPCLASLPLWGTPDLPYPILASDSSWLVTELLWVPCPILETGGEWSPSRKTLCLDWILLDMVWHLPI